MLWLPLITLVSNVVGEVSLGLEECLSLGFNTPNLMCSDCDTLNRFQLGELKKNCSLCCTEDGNKLDAAVKYGKAILEVCGWRLGAYPQVAAFIKSDRPAERYPGLTIKYVRGADPIIKLLDEDEAVAETLAIDKWNTDSVEEFLDIYLESADDKKATDESLKEEL